MTCRFPALLLLALLAPAATAADFMVKMPDGRALPRRLKNPGTPYAWVAAKGYPPRQLPAEGAEPSGAPATEFMEKFILIDEWQPEGQKGQYYLLGTALSDGGYQHHGWVEARACIKEPFALKNNFRIHRKAMVVNTVRAAREAIDQGTTLTEVPVLLSPRADGPRAAPFSLFSIYFLYADSNPGDPDDGFFLLGKQPTFLPNKLGDAARVVLGWIAKKRVCQWDTREALEWDAASTLPDAMPRRTTPGQVYAKSKDAKLALTEPAKVRPLFIEGFDDKGVSLQRRREERDPGFMRYPIIPIRDPEDRVTTPDRGLLYKVGFVGSFVDENGRELASSDEIEDIQRVLSRLRREMEVTEILFVIDATASMEKYYLAAAETILSIVKAVREDKGRKVRIAVTTYKDFDPSKGQSIDDAVVSRTLADADDASVEELARSMKAQAKEGLDGGGDAREQMFHGLRRGLRDAKFSPFARKIAVLIGDMGSHDPGGDGMGKTEREIARQLVSLETGKDRKPVLDRSPIELYALQVIDPKTSADAQAFKDQVEKVLEFTAEELDKVGLKDLKKGIYLRETDEGEVARRMLARFDELREQAERLTLQVEKLQRGQWADMKIGAELERILQSELRDPEKFDKLRRSRGAQVFHEGYVWEYAAPKVRQVRLKYLVSGGDLNTLVQALEKLGKPPSQRLTGHQMVELLLGTAIGEKVSFYDARLKADGLQVQSPLLKHSFAPGDGTLLTRDQEQELERVRKKYFLLEDIFHNRVHDFEETERDIGAGEKIKVWKPKGEPRNRTREFHLYGDKEAVYFWLDHEEEWP